MNQTPSKLNTILLIVIVVLLAAILIVFLTNRSVVQNAFPENIQKESYIPTKNTSVYENQQSKQSNTVATLDLSDPYTTSYKTTFTAALQKPADFNEHYVVVKNGCGSGCIAYSVLDKTTGRAYKGPTDDYGGNYQTPANFDANRYSLDSNLFKILGYSNIETYKFENGVFVLIN